MHRRGRPGRARFGAFGQGGRPLFPFDASNTPVVAGAEIVPNPGFEGAYVGGLAPNYTATNAPTVAESADAHDGTAAQQFTGTISNSRIHQSGAIATGKWYRASVYAKRTSGTSGDVHANFYDGAADTEVTPAFNQAAYTEYVMTGFAASGSPRFRVARTVAAAAWDTVLIDTASLKALSLPSLYTLVALSEVNGEFSADVTVEIGRVAGIAHVDSASDPQNGWHAYVNRYAQTATYATLHKRVGGTWTNVGNWAIAYAAGGKLKVTRTGNSFVVNYAGADLATVAIDDLPALTQFGGFRLDARDTVSGINHVEPAPADPFVIAFVPDSQNTVKLAPAKFLTEVKWIADNHVAENIVAVMHEGDIVNDVATAQQWTDADAAWDTLDAAEVPYLVTSGNHDSDGGTATRTTTTFNGTFPQARYTAHAWWHGGFFGADHSENAYCIVQAGGRQYLLLALEFGPRQAVIDWANALLTLHSDKAAIICTHSYLYRDGTRVGTGDEYNPHTYAAITADAHDGEEMWAELVKGHRNIIWVQSGHDLGAEARRQDAGDHGNVVNQVLANYQEEADGGNGKIRLVEFTPATRMASVTTYSPVTSLNTTDDANQFEVSY